MKNLLILSTQRSGSTLVCDDISGTGVLGRPTEYFMSLLDKAQSDNNTIKNGIMRIMSKGRTSNGCFSIKVMSNQIGAVGKLLIDAGICVSNSYQQSFWEFFTDYIVIRVIRDDKVAQAVSRVIAQETNVYHLVEKRDDSISDMLGKYTDEPRDEKTLKYSFGKIQKEIEKIIDEERFLGQFIERFGVDVINVRYEKIAHNRDYVKRIASICGLGDVNLIPRRLKKITGSIGKTWIEKYKSEINR